MSDPLALATAWPAARPAGISPIQHAAWEEARNAILDLVAEGPVTAVIVGQPGTGKTWLLRELASALGEHGFPTMMLMQGDLPMSVSSGAALLVDNADLMSRDARAAMAAQDHGVVILAAPEWTHDDPASPSPVIVPLRPLRLEETVTFAAEWLGKTGLSASMIEPDALFRLAEASDGIVVMLVRSLAETVTTSRQPTTPVAEKPPTPETPPEKTLADLIADTPLAQPIPLARAPARRATYRRVYRPLLAGAAIAALIVLAWRSMPVPLPTELASSPAAPPTPVAERGPTSPLPPLQQAETATPPQTTAATAIVDPATTTVDAAPTPLPPLGHADTPAPALATAAAPARPGPIPVPLAPPPPPPSPPPSPSPSELNATDIPVENHTPAPTPAIATAPPVLIPADPALVATFDDPATIPPAAPRRQSLFDRAGGPGLVLVARPGDTLESLYGSVYRDRSAPPFATVLAANPGHFKPGTIVIFPEPPGGWQRLQR